MLRLGRICILTGLLLAVSETAYSQSDEKNLQAELGKLQWQTSGAGQIAGRASVQIPNGIVFLGSSDTQRFLELTGNLPRSDIYTIAPKSLHWFGLFSFEDSGYVPDDEKLDPDALLEELKNGNRAGQEERKRRGLPSLVLEGWLVEPHYDLATKRLEWGTKLRADTNEISVNYTIKLLGRRGVMDAVLVSEPNTLEQDTREFKSILTGYTFNEGERYTEYRSGDKVAEYGLSALIIGGAAAAAAKSGAFKGIAKLIGIGVLGLLAAARGLYARLFRRA
jgi:uncharacterized membrane-anchored protein